MNSKQSYSRTMIYMSIISVILWVVFLVFYRIFWPDSMAGGDSLTIFWIWFVAGTAAFVAVTYFIFGWLHIPREWHAAAAIAFSAPAFILDMLATLNFELWSSGADPRFYPALILGGTGVILFSVLFSSAPSADSS